MKNLMMAVVMLITCTTSMAQGIQEPEYIGQVALVQSDSSQVVLVKEEAEMKTKTSGFGYIPIPGSSLLNKGKTFLRVKGDTSPNKIAKGEVQLIVRVKDNNEDPKNSIGVFQFETKEERAQIHARRSWITFWHEGNDILQYRSIRGKEDWGQFIHGDHCEPAARRVWCDHSRFHTYLYLLRTINKKLHF